MGPAVLALCDLTPAPLEPRVLDGHPEAGSSHCRPPQRRSSPSPGALRNHFPSVLTSVLTVSWVPHESSADPFLPGPQPPLKRSCLSCSRKFGLQPVSGEAAFGSRLRFTHAQTWPKSEHTAPGHKLERAGTQPRLAAVTQALLPCNSQNLLGKRFQTTDKLKSEKPGKTISVCLETFLLHLISGAGAEKSGWK